VVIRIVIGVSAVGVLALVLWFTLSCQLTVRRLARSMRQQRALAFERESRHRPVRPEDRLPDSEQAALDAVWRELEGHSARALGQVVELKSDGTSAGIAHWFAADPSTAYGWIGMVGQVPLRRPVMVLFSHANDGQFAVTRWGIDSVGALASGPSIHRLMLSSKTPIGEVLRQHNELATRVSPGSLRQVSELDGALAGRLELTDTRLAWRAQQPEQALLEADVRGILLVSRFVIDVNAARPS